MTFVPVGVIIIPHHALANDYDVNVGRSVGLPLQPVGVTELPSSLVAWYRAEAPNVIVRAGCERPTKPVAEGIDVTRAEFENAVTHEGAMTAEDILDRRTRIGVVETDHARAADVEFLARVG